MVREPPIQETLAKIIEAASPVKVVLFGSAARGEMGPHSDLDFLVIVPDGTHRRRTAQAIYLRLLEVGFASDIVVVTESDVLRHRENRGLVIKAALDEGKLLYAA